MSPREPKDVYFLRLAHVVATQATCARKHVGAVLVRDGIVIGTGYNGAVRGAPHCDDEGHMMRGAEEAVDELDAHEENDHNLGERLRARLSHCVRTVHAEANAIIQAAREGHRTLGTVLYTTASPCFECLKLAVNAGVREVVYAELYRDEQALELAPSLGILVRQVVVRGVAE